MQQQGNTSTLQRYKHHKNTSHGTQGQGQETSEEWGYLQIQMPTHALCWGVHWRVWEIWGQAQRTSQGPIPHPSTQQFHRTPIHPRLLPHSPKGVTGNIMKYQRGHNHLGKWPFFKQELGQYQLPHIWTKFCKTLWHFSLNKPTPSSTSPYLDPPPHLLTIVGAQHLLGKYSMWGCHSYTLSYLTLPHTPLIPITPLLSGFIGAIFGKYPYLFS